MAEPTEKAKTFVQGFKDAFGLNSIERKKKSYDEARKPDNNQQIPDQVKSMWPKDK